MICVYVTGVAIAKAISSLCYHSIFSTESPQLLKATWRASHWTQKALDQALGYFPTNKLGLTRLAAALHVWRSWKLLKPQQLSWKNHLKMWEQAGSWEPCKICSPKRSALSPLHRGAAALLSCPPQALQSPAPVWEHSRGWWIALESFPEHWFATGLSQGKLLALY